MWLEPNFLFPDWTTNSDFIVISPIALGLPTAQGLPTATATVANADIQVTMYFEMVDTTTGIEQGLVGAGLGGGGSSMTSRAHILVVNYEILNTAGANITGLSAFQFLHSLNAETSSYDSRSYGSGTYSGFRYDTTQVGLTYTGLPVPITDWVAFHSDVAPVAWDNDYYGIGSTDDHASGKPSVGTHLAVEADALNMVDTFAPPELWVGGAQKYALPDLAPAATTNFTVLLTIQTDYGSSMPTVPSVGGIGGVLLFGAMTAIGARRLRREQR